MNTGNVDDECVIAIFFHFKDGCCLYAYAHVEPLDSVYLVGEIIFDNYLKNSLKVTDYRFISISVYFKNFLLAVTIGLHPSMNEN